MTAIHATGIGVSNTGLIFTTSVAHITRTGPTACLTSADTAVLTACYAVTDTNATTDLALTSTAAVITAYCAIAGAREILRI